MSHKSTQTDERLSFKVEMLRGIFEYAPDAMLVINKSGTIEQANGQVRNIFGYKPKELIGRPIEILIPGRFQKNHITNRSSYMKNPHLRPMGKDLSLFGKRKDESEFPVEIMLSPVRSEEDDLVVAVVRDITQRQKSKEALQKSESQLRAITQSAIYAIIAADSKGNIISWNSGAENIFGHTEDEVFGRSLTIIMPEKYRKTHEMGMNRHVETGESHFIGQVVELQGLRKNGDEFPLELSLSTWETMDGKFYSGIIRDITEKKQIYLEFEKARDTALESVKLKAEFLANMSHEIRTPMNGVIGMTGLLLDTTLSDEQRDYAETIENSAESLLRIIDDILDFSKIEARQLRFENIEIDLSETIENTLDLHAEKAYSKDVELISLIHKDVPKSIFGDPVRIGQVLTNLIGNAIKFTNSGEIIVRAELLREYNNYAEIYFEVKDTGMGISEEAQQKLFQAFIQADGSMTRKHGGTGLGLAISKQLVELMGGEIAVQSNDKKGSTFWFTGKFKKCEKAVIETPSQNVANLHGAKVLIVDDNKALCQILLKHAANWGMNCVVVTTCREAFDLLHEEASNDKPFDLALLDLTMPVMDGFELAKIINADAKLAHTKLVLMSPITRREHTKNDLKEGLSEFLFKPIRQNQLRSCLIKVLAQTGKNKEKTSRDLNQLSADKQVSSDIKILVAEDNPISQKVILVQLQKLGYYAKIMENGLEVVNEFKRNKYDIVLMDLQMPEMDGYKATSEIRSIEKGVEKIPIIAITAHALEGEQQKCLAADMDDYLSKPVDIERLDKTIKKWAKAREIGN